MNKRIHCCVGCKERTEATMAALEVLPEPQQSLCQTTLSMCAYAGTGDVLVVQQMLHICSKHYETDVSTRRILLSHSDFPSFI